MDGMSDIDCMRLALELAASGRGYVAPNPMVGAVLCHEGRIIGQGYHQQFGGPHAEVNCFESVQPADEALIQASTLYVTLEPCSHFGKTPPCAELLIRKGVGRVVVAAIDPNEKVRGQGMNKLKAAGIHVEQGILEKEAIDLNCRFFTSHLKRRPYVTLKWAETANGYMGTGTSERLFISGPATNKMVHEWRAAEDAILIGAGTAVLDNPLLTVRLTAGRSPLRIILQTSRPLSQQLNMFQDGLPVVVINAEKEGVESNITYVKLNLEQGPEPLMTWLHKNNLQGLMVEGGRNTLQYFLKYDCWDEIRIIKSNRPFSGEGIRSPELPLNVIISQDIQIYTDTITTYKKI
jgi:diaminohydroxyphosphoribosylaminopyrimidine deaminase/5-amino-6-(5-phosphoribosylamino)uracil reductase